MPISMEEILTEGRAKGASHIFLKPMLAPMLRVGGQLKISDYDQLTVGQIHEIVSTLLSDEQQSILKQQKRVLVSQESARHERVLFSICKCFKGYCISIKLLPGAVLSLDSFDLLPKNFTELLLKRGLIIIAGRARSGKTTTLAAIIDWLNSECAEHIISIEDMVEYQHKNRKSIVSQIELCGSAFNSGLSGAIAQSPDVLAIDVDKLDVEAVMDATRSARLVLVTVNANSATDAVEHFAGLLPEHQAQVVREDLAAALLGLSCQVLARRTSVRVDLPPQFQNRVAVPEVLINVASVASCIKQGNTAELYSLMEDGKACGMQTLESALRLALKDGIIDVQEALSKTNRSDELNKFLGISRRGPGGLDGEPPSAAIVRFPSF